MSNVHEWYGWNYIIANDVRIVHSYCHGLTLILVVFVIKLDVPLTSEVIISCNVISFVQHLPQVRTEDHVKCLRLEFVMYIIAQQPCLAPVLKRSTMPWLSRSHSVMSYSASYGWVAPVSNHEQLADCQWYD